MERGITQVTQLTQRAVDVGAHIVMFPELSLVGYDLDRLDDDHAWSRVDDARFDSLRHLCLGEGIAVVIGVAHSSDDGRRILASMFVHPDGTVAYASKQHLHGCERVLSDRGEPVGPVDLHGWRLGLAVCFDAAVPMHAQRLADAGADAYLVSAPYAAGEYERMTVHLGALAMDHRLYSLGVNFASHHRPADSCGGSGVWGPDGRCIVRADDGPTLLTADLNANTLANWHDPNPV